MPFSTAHLQHASKIQFLTITTPTIHNTVRNYSSTHSLKPEAVKIRMPLGFAECHEPSSTFLVALIFPHWFNAILLSTHTRKQLNNFEVHYVIIFHLNIPKQYKKNPSDNPNNHIKSCYEKPVSYQTLVPHMLHSAM